MKNFIRTQDSLHEESDDSLIWLMFYMRCTMKNAIGKIKKDTAIIIQVLEKINTMKGLPIKGEELKIAYQKIPLDTMQGFQKLI